MQTRRQILRLAGRLLPGALLALIPGWPAGRPARAAAVKRRILPRNTDPQSLVNQDPRALDTRHLPLMPLEAFETMGLSDHAVDLDAWRLVVDGRVAAPLSLAYAEVLALAPIERNVLLICPGIFTIHARWKGVPLARLLELAGAAPGCTGATVRGPAGAYEKVEGFSLEEIRSGGVFLAHGVNGERLPRRHGFPLRAVAPDRAGRDWVKYVCRVVAV
jgi:sulfoxide reductase catalytic subunit YedY